MTLIEGFGDEVTIFLCALVITAIVFLAWLSTHTTDIPFFRLVIVNLMNRNGGDTTRDASSNEAPRDNNRRLNNVNDITNLQEENVIAEVDILSDGTLGHNVSSVEFLTHEEADNLIDRLDIPRGDNGEIHVEEITTDSESYDSIRNNSVSHAEMISSILDHRASSRGQNRNMTWNASATNIGDNSDNVHHRDSPNLSVRSSDRLSAQQDISETESPTSSDKPQQQNETAIVNSENISRLNSNEDKNINTSDNKLHNNNRESDNETSDASIEGACGFTPEYIGYTGSGTHVLGGARLDDDGLQESETTLRRRRVAYFDRQNKQATASLSESPCDENKHNTKKPDFPPRKSSNENDSRNHNIRESNLGQIPQNLTHIPHINRDIGGERVIADHDSINADRRLNNLVKVDIKATTSQKDSINVDKRGESGTSDYRAERGGSGVTDDRTDRGESGMTDNLDNAGDEGRMKVRLVYLNDTHREVMADPVQTIAEFRQAHFAEEMANNKLVRFIYNGNVLRNDASTLQSYNIRHNSAVHCLITQNLQTQHTQHPPDETPFDLSGLMFPLFAVLLAIVWYLRFTYRRYFNTMSTFSLAVISLLFVASYLAPILDSYSRRRRPPTQRT